MKGFDVVRLGWAIAGVLLAGTVSLAQGPGGGMGPGPGFEEHRPPMEKAFAHQGDHGRWWNNPKAIERLKLTDEQRKSFDGILLEHREKLIDLRASLEKAELVLEPLMGDDQPNEAKILAQIDQVAQARAELEKANARFLLAIRAKLTPEQWKQLEQWKHSQADRGDRGPQPRGKGADMQGPGGWKQGGQGHQQAVPPPPLASPTDVEPQAPAAAQPGAEK
ncbi:MAG: Spy/CpxP family protein refolding chaperone [Terracidiphilus sp.]